MLSITVERLDKIGEGNFADWYLSSTSTKLKILNKAIRDNLTLEQAIQELNPIQRKTAWDKYPEWRG